MLERSQGERVLRAVTDEARRQTGPEPSEALEGRLFDVLASQRVGPSERAPLGRARLVWLAPVAVALGAAAAIALWPAAVDVSKPPVVARQVAGIDGDVVTAERVLTAARESVEVRHAGRAVWRLEPGSQASVLESGSKIRVRLLRGAMRAEVVPDGAPERFVVEAGETRVSVHGTVFRVALEGDESVVDVEHGIVAVAPLRGASLEPLFLRAPSSGRFGSDGRLRTSVASSRPKIERAPHVRRPVSEQPGLPPSARVEPAPPHELTIGEVEAGVATVVQAITRCFHEHTAPEGGVRVTASSTVTMTISPEGAVTDLRFAPPLSPPVQACSERDARTARFARSVGATITRVVELWR
jgi:ferric-dicitrate binding protein FerR (iron transport regulator)